MNEDYYNDADIEMAHLNEVGDWADAVKRNAKREPSREDLRQVEAAAYDACYYFNPVFEAVLQTCEDLGIDPDHDLVQDAMFEGAMRAQQEEG